MSNLKPCPFFGCKDIRKSTHLTHSEVFCSDCMAGITRELLFGKYDSFAEAEADVGVEVVEAWNRRAEDV